MGQYTQTTLWGSEDFVSTYKREHTDKETINNWLIDIVSATQFKQLVSLADVCTISVSKEQPTYWYTLRFVMVLKKYGTEVKVEVEQDDPYEPLRIVSVWVRAENLISKKRSAQEKSGHVEKSI
jgi:hypothetical protein